MTKYRTKLFIALITLIIAVLIGLGILLGQLFKSYYLQSFNERLKIDNNLLSFYIQENGGINSFNQQAVFDISDILHVRATVTDTEGNILYDTGKVKNNADSGLSEIIPEVIKKSPKQDEKFEEGDGFDFHYYWEPIKKDELTEGYIFLSIKTNELKQAYGQIWWILSISLGLALIVIVYLGHRITSSYTRPIEEAAKTAQELAKGNYRARASSVRLDETGILASSINMLAEGLQELKRNQEIQQDRLRALIENIGAGLVLIDSRGYINLINKGYIELFHVQSADYLQKLYYEVIDQVEVCQIVAEVFRTEHKVSKQLHVPLGIQRKYFDVYGVPIMGKNNVWKGVLVVFHDITELKNLELMRKDFVANVSHELKTPVTSIKGFSETLLDGAMNNQETLESFLSIILKESDRLQSLIQDLLELSKLESHSFTLNKQELNLHQLLEEVVTLLSGKAKTKNISLDLICPISPVAIRGDVDRLKQVFINLIANAITYTPSHGVVTVKLVEHKNSVVVMVKDTGIGIEEKEIPRIFERFYRVDRARSRNSGGTGLGLAIVKHIVEAHHGNLSVESEVGKGSVFKVELHN
ncbi:two-component system histidine kinase PnpS [Neobacillus dielmonensis]|uniref:two-component system histidine kinase PnpS n=1 Tax=Neobacillus dielmonensis TaxID=1347369 RepID=UPI0005A96CF5|nr:ATP-binding protein [Neobacillus dielmonensis]